MDVKWVKFIFHTQHEPNSTSPNNFNPVSHKLGNPGVLTKGDQFSGLNLGIIPNNPIILGRIQEYDKSWKHQLTVNGSFLNIKIDVKLGSI